MNYELWNVTEQCTRAYRDSSFLSRTRAPQIAVHRGVGRIDRGVKVKGCPKGWSRGLWNRASVDSREGKKKKKTEDRLLGKKRGAKIEICPGRPIRIVLKIEQTFHSSDMEPIYTISPNQIKSRDNFTFLYPIIIRLKYLIFNIISFLIWSANIWFSC